MKKYIVSFLLLVFILSIEGCASKPAGEQSVVNSVEQNAASDTKKNNQTEEKLRFDDWKYKGFGQKLPVWAEFAIDSDNINLIKVISQVYNVNTVTVVIGEGENSDQAEQAAKDLEAQLLSKDGDYKYFDSTWIRENINLQKVDKPYKAVYVYYK